MFTGIIQEIGRVLRIERRNGTRITVAAPRSSRTLKRGDSIAVSGVCLTAVEIAKGKSFAADLAQETIQRTSLADLKSGTEVNLELPIPAGTPLGGHIVQGHVDGMARVLAFDPVSSSKSQKKKGWTLRIEIPRELTRYIVEKGSITIEGVSLTVAKIEDDKVSIAIIPHTYDATNLHSKRAGDSVNIEVDVLAKYAEKQAAHTKKGEGSEAGGRITLERLVEEGF